MKLKKRERHLRNKITTFVIIIKTRMIHIKRIFVIFIVAIVVKNAIVHPRKR